MENPWEAKLYKKGIVKKFINLLIPKQGTKQYRKVTQLLKEAASKLKMEWLYIDRVAVTIVAFAVTLFIFMQMHNISINYVYTEPVSDYNLLMGAMSESDNKKGMKLTEQDNYFLDKFKNTRNVKEEDIRKEVERSEFYEGATEEEIDKTVERIIEKLKIVQTEYLKWFELLISFTVAGIGYYGPIFLLMFQKRMRQM